MLKLTEEGNYKSLHLDELDTKYPNDNNEDKKMPNIKHITHISDHFINERTICIRSRSSIQFTWNRFKSIKFDDNQREQTDELVGDEDTIAYMEDIPGDIDNNCHPFRYNIDYAWAKFL